MKAIFFSGLSGRFEATRSAQIKNRITRHGPNDVKSIQIEADGVKDEIHLWWVDGQWRIGFYQDDKWMVFDLQKEAA